jgi:hypothetical protein
MQLRGKVTDIVCDYKKDSWMTAFVTFSKTDQAEKAIASLNGRRVFKVINFFLCLVLFFNDFNNFFI